MRGIAAEEGRFGIRANTVGPGMLTEGMAERLMDSGDLDEAERDVWLAKGLGGKGKIDVSRFKGLGEMDAEELRDTTLNPENRTLLQVTMDDATAADDLFRILMGDKVEPRREFIEKHALEARNLDV